MGHVGNDYLLVPAVPRQPPSAFWLGPHPLVHVVQKENVNNFPEVVDQARHQHSPPPKELEGLTDRESLSKVSEKAVSTEPSALKLPGPR